MRALKTSLRAAAAIITHKVWELPLLGCSACTSGYRRWRLMWAAAARAMWHIHAVLTELCVPSSVFVPQYENLYNELWNVFPVPPPSEKGRRWEWGCSFLETAFMTTNSWQLPTPWSCSGYDHHSRHWPLLRYQPSWTDQFLWLKAIFLPRRSSV